MLYAWHLTQALRARGYEVFLDVKDIRDGEWWPQLEAGITSTRNFILVLSPGMFAERKEDWVNREILHAQASGRKHPNSGVRDAKKEERDG